MNGPRVMVKNQVLYSYISPMEKRMFQGWFSFLTALCIERSEMIKSLVSISSGILICFFACCAFGDILPPHLYEVKVRLINGQSITGATYGLEGFFVGGTSARQVRSVQLSHTGDSVEAHFTFFDESQSEIYKRSSAQASRSELSVFTTYEAVNQQPTAKYYWIKEQMKVPIINILRIDTLKIIGKGYAIFQDPALYSNIKEPYLIVEDCGIGCPAKLYSENKSITKAQLKKLWDKHLDCKHRNTPETTRRMNAVMTEYQLKILIDPFCID